MRTKSTRVAFMLQAVVTLAPADLVSAGQTDWQGPAGSSAFGRGVTVLPNGNVVVLDPSYNVPGGPSSAGAVRLYSPEGTLISLLTGSQPDDRVGSGGVTVLANGHFVVTSHEWDNGTQSNAGAVTWASMIEGVSGVVSAANSLVGTTISDQVGQGGVTALRNGNYVISSPTARINGISMAGAVTWGNGETGIVGAVTAANSLVGTLASSRVGTTSVGGGVFEVGASHYVVSSPFWRNSSAESVGAVTWCNGSTGRTGPVTPQNSLVGPSAGSVVGYREVTRGVTVLANGHYVVTSDGWDRGSIPNVGAVTWCHGNTGRVGVVSEANSLVGATADDHISREQTTLPGLGGVVPLANGHYVVASPRWDKGNVVDAGAVTWCHGGQETIGVVSTTNSLTGTSTSDYVGRVTPLTSGDYVVGADHWDNGPVMDVGAVRVISGTSPESGAFSTSNSLTGTDAGQRISSGGIVALTNGNCVVSSPRWHTEGLTGLGAVTWVNAGAFSPSLVTRSNSLTGSHEGDYVGGGPTAAAHSGRVTALTNGHFVVTSPRWKNGTAYQAGAVTWGNGLTGIAGPVSTQNSLVGGSSSLFVGGGFDTSNPGGVTALSNGNYLVGSPNWNDGAIRRQGAVTWVDGTRPIVATVSSANSLAGTHQDQYLGSVAATAFPGGAWAMINPTLTTEGKVSSGAVVFGDGVTPVTGVMNSSFCVFGTAVNGGTRLRTAYDATGARLIVGRPSDNLVTVLTPGAADLPVLEVETGSGTALENGATFSFGTIAPGTQKVLSVVFRNTGYAPLEVQAPVSSNPLFSFVLPEGVTSLERNQEVRFRVVYQPASEGTHAAVLRVTTNDPHSPLFAFNVTGTASSGLEAVMTDLLGPAGSQYFGATVTYLPNGNLVVTDPGFDAPGPVVDVGAVYLYSAAGTLISRLTGSTAGDRVGNGGIKVLANGNFIIVSGAWSHAGAARAGAVTWASATTGVDGAVTSANSLVGTQSDDDVGGMTSFTGQSTITLLPNGNYVVVSPKWNRYQGAVTWGNGASGVTGAVSAANSVVDCGAVTITVLANGHYVACSDLKWTATWLSGTAATAGTVSAANSVVVFENANTSPLMTATALTDGNYVVSCPRLWVNGVQEAGAAMWCSGAGPTATEMRASNALTGSHAGDRIGEHGVTPLPGGRFAIISRTWNGERGAVTWGASGSALTGRVSTTNSLIGETRGDRVGWVTVLRSGDAVVATHDWSHGTVPRAGAVTWCELQNPVVGVVSAANSLVGIHPGDQVGIGGITELESGDYVVASPTWDGVLADQGAVTWCPGGRGRTGPVTAGNSLTGAAAGVLAGAGGVSALKSGAYVIASPYLKNADGTQTGAVTWMQGTTEHSGLISPANSLIECRECAVVPLANGHYLVHSLGWSENRGAVTWGHGWKPLTGLMSEDNSLTGRNVGDFAGARQAGINTPYISGIETFPNGHYLVCSPHWADGARAAAGAITWGNGQTGVRGAISGLNSLTGDQAHDWLGSATARAFRSGNAFAVVSGAAKNAGGQSAGVVTMGVADAGAVPVGHPSSLNSVFPEARLEIGYPVTATHAPSQGTWAVGRPQDSMVTFFIQSRPATGELAVEGEGGSDYPTRAEIHFGFVELGMTRARLIHIVNRGTAAMTLDELMFSDARFSASTPPPPPILAPGASVAVLLEFKPSGPGLARATLTVGSNSPRGSAVVLNLVGSGLPPPGQLFGQQTDGEALTLMPASGRVEVRFQGWPGMTYLVETSSRLLQWTPYLRVNADEDGAVKIIDPLPLESAWFYRLRWVPPQSP